jgi:hypothetical protein
MGESTCVCICKLEVSRSSAEATVVRTDGDVLTVLERATVRAIVKAILAWLNRRPEYALVEAAVNIHKTVNLVRAQFIMHECRPLADAVAAGRRRAGVTPEAKDGAAD